jgi:hypothetical protein
VPFVEKEEGGEEFTVILTGVMMEVQPPSDTCRVTFLFPAVAHITEWGPSPVPGVAMPPAKFHVNIAVGLDCAFPR